MGRAVTAISGGDSPSSSSAESNFREHDDVFLQTQTRIWLSEILQTRLDDQVDLSELIADGELLFDISKLVWNMLLVKCKELRYVKEPKFLGSVTTEIADTLLGPASGANPIGSRKSIGRYRPYSNVDSFLKICKILGVYSVDLFSPSDVVEKRDTRKVCICIRSFSKKARTKQLKVPDFDIVTYTIHMPTVMVGSLRRSLEFSRCSTKASSKYTPRRDSKSKSRRKIRVGFWDENDGVYSEASDDTESNYMRQLTYSLSKRNSHDSAKSKGIDDSPEVSSGLCKSKGDILELENNDHVLRHSGSSCSGEKSTSLCSEYGESCSVMNNISSPSVDSRRSLCGRDIDIEDDLRNYETDFPDTASFVGDPLDNMVERLYLSPQFAFPDITLGLDNENVLFDGDDNVYDLLMGFESRSNDDCDDVEVSSVSSMSSVFGRVLDLNFDEHFDVSDLRHEIQDIDDYENSEHGFTSDTENPILEPQNGNFGFSNKSPLSCSSSHSHAVENEEHFGSLKNDSDVSKLSSIEEPHLKIEEHKMDCQTLNEASAVIRACLKGCLVVPCNSSITVEKCQELDSLNGGLDVEVTQQCSNPNKILDASCLKHEGICTTELTSKDESKCLDVEDLAELTDGKEDAEKKLSNIKFHIRPLLGTIVKGTAVFGIMFFLLHLRNRCANENEDKRDKKSDGQHVNGTRNSIKAQKRGRENGVYPADKFKFQN